MLVLRGAAALSRFRLQKLSERLQTAVGANVRIASSFMHFIDTEGELAPRQSKVLAQLLEYGPRAESGGESGGRLFLVAPRPGLLRQLHRLPEGLEAVPHRDQREADQPQDD